MGLQQYYTMADVTEEVQKKKRTFRKFTFRGVDLDQLLDMSMDQLLEMMDSRVRRRFRRGLKRKHMALLKKLRGAKKEASDMESPLLSRLTSVTWSSSPRWLDPWWVFTMAKFSTVLKSSLKIRSSFGRVQHLLQTCQARKAWYWCHPQLPFYSIEVNFDLENAGTVNTIHWL